MPTKVAEAYVAIRANTATLMADLQAAKGITTQGAIGIGNSFAPGMAPGIQAANAQIMTIPATTAKAGAAVKAQTLGMSGSFLTMAKSMAGAMGVMAVGVGFVAGGKAAVDFEQALINATAAMPDATENMQALEMAARDWGIESGVGAAKAADAIGYLALAGYNAEKSMQALPLVLKFAGAGAFDAATGSDILTDAMSALGLASDDTAEHMENMTMVADLMSKASVTANTSVQQLGEAMLMKAGPAAKTAGMDVQDLTGMLMIFADQGRKGSEAGTLAAATILGLSKSAAKFKDSNLNKVVFDSAGNMRSLKDIVKGLTAEFGDMSAEERTAALMALGVNKQAADGVNLLMGQTDQLEKYNNALNESSGATEELAQKKWKAMGQQLGVLKAQFADFAISIIGPFVSGLISIVKPLANIAVAIGRWSQANNDIIPKIMKVTAVVVGLKVLLPLLAMGIKMVAKSLMGAMMSNPFTAAILGISLLVQWMWDAHKAGAEWMKPVAAAMNTVVEWLKKAWEGIKIWAASLMTLMAPAWEALKAVVMGVVNFFIGLWTEFTDMMDSKISGTRTGWETAWEVMTNVFEAYVAIYRAMWEALSTAFLFVIDTIGAAWEYMFGTTLGEAISGAWGTLMGWLGQVLDLMSLLTSNWGLTWELVKEVFYLRFLQISDFFKTVVDAIIVGVAYILGAFVGTFKAIGDYVRWTFQTMWAETKAWFNGLIAMAQEAWKKITMRGSGRSLSDTFNEAFDESMAGEDIKEVKGFKERINEEMESWGGGAAAGAAQRQKRRDAEIAASEQRVTGIAEDMVSAREAKRQLEDEDKRNKLETAEEVGEKEKEKAEEAGEAQAEALAEKITQVSPEIGFKGIAEFGRSIQDALLKEKDANKQRDDKQAADTTGIRNASERALEVQEEQLEVMRDQGNTTGLSSPA